MDLGLAVPVRTAQADQLARTPICGILARMVLPSHKPPGNERLKDVLRPRKTGMLQEAYI